MRRKFSQGDDVFAALKEPILNSLWGRRLSWTSPLDELVWSDTVVLARGGIKVSLYALDTKDPQFVCLNPVCHFNFLYASHGVSCLRCAW